MNSIMEDFYAEETDAALDSAEAKAGRWTAEEHALFLQGLKLYSKQWKQIAELVKTRTVVQIRTHAQKYFQKMEKQNGKRSKYSDADGLEEGGSRSSTDSRSEDENPPYCFRSSTQQAHVSSATTSEGESDEPDSPLPPPSSPRKRGRDKKQSGLTLNLRVSKRPNVRSESDLSLESAVSFSMASSYDEFLPLVEEEGEELDESIYNLLDKIDWHAESRVHSPFMDSAASVSTSLDSLEALPFFDFASAHLHFGGHDSFPMPFSVQRIPVAVPPPQPAPMTLPPVPEQADPESLKVHKTVIQEIKQIVHGGPRVGVSNAKVTKYDKLPSIRALMKMTASGMSVQCPQSLTPSNSLVHYQMLETDQVASGMTSSEHSPRAKDVSDALFLHLDYDDKKLIEEPIIAIRMPLQGVATSNSHPVAASHSPPL